MTVTWKNCFKICFCAFLLFLGIRYFDTAANLFTSAIKTLSPILLGLAAAYVLNILMSFIERHYFTKFKDRAIVKKTRRPVCIVLSMIILAALLVLVVYIILPQLVSGIKFIVDQIPPLIEDLLELEFVKSVLPSDTLTKLNSIDWFEYVETIVKTFGSGIGDAVGAVFSAIFSLASFFITLVIAVIFSIYLLYGKDKLKSQIKRIIGAYVKDKTAERFYHILDVINDCFHRYIVGQCTEALILGFLCALGMLILDFPYAGMVGTLVCITALIPIAGAYIGAGVGALVILTESPVKAVLFLIFIFVLQQIEGNIIYPKVVGKSIGLPAIWVLTAVTVGGGLGGIFGMLVSVPITAAIYRLVREDVEKREQLK